MNLTITIITAAVLTVLLFGLTPLTATATATTSPTTTNFQTYTSIINNIAFEYPSDWVTQDFEVYGEEAIQRLEAQFGYRAIVSLCTADVAIPSLGGGHDCQAAGDDSEGDTAVYSFGFSDLDETISRQFGGGVGGTQNATVDDVMAYHLQTIVTPDSESSSIDDSQTVDEIVSRVVGTVPVIDEETNQQIGTAQSLLTEYVYSSDEYSFAPETRAYMFFAIYNNDGISIGLEGTADDLDSGETPEILQTVADSFRFVVSDSDDDDGTGGSSSSSSSSNTNNLSF